MYQPTTQFSQDPNNDEQLSISRLLAPKNINPDLKLSLHIHRPHTWSTSTRRAYHEAFILSRNLDSVSVSESLRLWVRVLRLGADGAAACGAGWMGGRLQ